MKRTAKKRHLSPLDGVAETLERLSAKAARQRKRRRAGCWEDGFEEGQRQAYHNAAAMVGNLLEVEGEGL